jgi:hypothetical protein
MLSLDECIALSDLTADEIAVIAEHEHVPEVVATGIGHELLKTPKGLFKLRAMISEVLARAKLTGERERARHLDRVLARFNKVHPVPRVL